MTEPLLFSSAPVFEVDGLVKRALVRDVLRLESEETTAGLKTLTARFIAHGPVAGSPQEMQLYLDGTVLDFGKRLAVSIGPESGARTIFRGFISGLEACFHEGREPEVVVFAEDQLMSLRMTRRSRTYENVTDAEIVQAIATEHGLAAETDADGPTYDLVQQWNMSDLAFLRERARLLQAEIWIQDETLYFQTREKRTGTALTLIYGNHLLDLQARADLAHQRTAVKISGYNASAHEKIDEEAGSNTIETEIVDGRTGPAILQRAFGERISYRVREVPITEGEARAWARAEMLRRARSFVTIVATTRGTPDMMVGSRVTLERVGQPFNGPGYYVTRVCHTYDLQHGHRTRFEAERATIQEGA